MSIRDYGSMRELQGGLIRRGEISVRKWQAAEQKRFLLNWICRVFGVRNAIGSESHLGDGKLRKSYGDHSYGRVRFGHEGALQAPVFSMRGGK